MGVTTTEPIYLETPAAVGGYGFNSLEGGLIYFGLFLGSITGTILVHPFIDRVNMNLVRKHKGDVKPEYRLKAMWPALPMSAFSLGLFAICLNYRLHWIGIAIGNFFTQFTNVLVTSVATT